jgi:hypothetical protein
VTIRTADGRTRSFELGGGLRVADFDARIRALLGELDIDVEIKELPFGVPMTTPFPEDLDHASLDRDAFARFGRILDWSDSVLEEFSGWFDRKTSPVHLFWHGLHLAVTRFSGRPGVPLDADPVPRRYSAMVRAPSCIASRLSGVAFRGMSASLRDLCLRAAHAAAGRGAEPDARARRPRRASPRPSRRRAGV